ncbi:MAG TPA: hypothetical protein VFJ11_05060 [Gaiellaceae bacterium]|nr:hypothetical protein [Gaiellaceae bacterium]
MTEARLIYVLLIASLFAYTLACLNVGHLFGGHGMSDGGGH